jgi:hypothetical protein
VDDDREGRLGVVDAQLSVHREDPVGRLLTGIVDVDPAGSGVGSRVDVSAQQSGRFGQRVVEPEAVGDEDDDVANRLPVGAGSET